MKEAEMKVLADLIDRALINKDNETALADLKQEVKNLCQHFPIYKK
jgi:glycine/serine hydroxymethyltransferase